MPIVCFSGRGCGSVSSDVMCHKITIKAVVVLISVAFFYTWMNQYLEFSPLK